MTFRLTVRADRPPPFQGLLRSVGFNDLQTVEDVFEASSWAHQRWHIYRHDVSARAIEIGFANKRFFVAVPTPAAVGDYELAVRFAQQAALYFEEGIETEEFGEVSMADLGCRFNLEWIEETSEAGIQSLIDAIEEDRATRRLDGPMRPFFAGPRLLGKLLQDRPVVTLPQRLMALMRKAQYLDPEQYYPAEDLVLVDNVGQRASFSVWSEGVGYVFGVVDFLALLDRNGDPFLIPADRHPLLAGPACRWLDERQTLVEPISGDNWLRLVDLAEHIRVGSLKPPCLLAG